MADHAVAHFQNDGGVRQIEVGVKELMCCGASAPHDHPHVFLDMGSDNEIICPYCSTVYKFSPDLSATQTRPEGCIYENTAA